MTDKAARRILVRVVDVGSSHATGILAPAVAALLLLTTQPLGPGGKIGTMRLARGVAATADLKLFDFCDPVITQPGTYRRTCARVPQFKRMFIGYGSFFTDPADLDADWRSTRWQMWLDGKKIALRAFGTSDRTLLAFPPAGGKNVTLREWRVMLVGPTVGRHVIRYRSVTGTDAIDATWVFRVWRP